MARKLKIQQNILHLSLNYLWPTLNKQGKNRPNLVRDWLFWPSYQSKACESQIQLTWLSYTRCEKSLKDQN
jgi:hypothetical protein